MTCTNCAEQAWLYAFVYGNPAGLAVRFDHGRVAAVYALATP